MNFQRIGAIIERELRKFVRTPVVLLMTLVMPLMQLFILGNAFGGRITNLKLAIVDQDGGPASRRVQEAIHVLQANGSVVRPIAYGNERDAAVDVRNGKVQGALVIPANFSRAVYSGASPALGLFLDNTDNFVHTRLRQLVTGAVQEAERDRPTPRVTSAVSVQPVELYSYTPYMRYMLPGVLTLGLFMSVMVGGGIMYLDDKQRGVHEGYLVTPITTFELVLAQNLAGTFKASLGGMLIIIVGALVTGATAVFEPIRFVSLIALVLLTSFAFMSMTSCFVARMNNPVLPRAIFGMLNTLLYFPSGAVYPTQALPGWLQVMAQVNPFTYAVHALRASVIKGSSVSVILPDLLFLAVFGVLMFAGTVALFRRTL